MPKNHLADNFNRCAGPGGVCGSMSPQIMGFELYIHQFSRLNHDIPGSGITEWEDSFVWAEVFGSDIFLKAFGHLFRDIDRFRFLSAFRII